MKNEKWKNDYTRTAKANAKNKVFSLFIHFLCIYALNVVIISLRIVHSACVRAIVSALQSSTYPADEIKIMILIELIRIIDLFDSIGQHSIQLISFRLRSEHAIRFWARTDVHRPKMNEEIKLPSKMFYVSIISGPIANLVLCDVLHQNKLTEMRTNVFWKLKFPSFCCMDTVAAGRWTSSRKVWCNDRINFERTHEAIERFFAL